MENSKKIYYKVVEKMLSETNISLKDLSEYICAGCEVFEVVEENELKSENYLGSLSNNAIFHISIEAADYAVKCYIKRYGEETTKEAVDCLNLCRIVAEDPLCKEKEMLKGMGDTFDRYGQRLLFTTGQLTDMLRVVSRCRELFFNDSSIYEVFRYSLYSIEDQMTELPYKEKMKEMGKLKERYGQFIIDFLKSGRHLFMV